MRRPFSIFARCLAERELTIAEFNPLLTGGSLRDADRRAKWHCDLSQSPLHESPPFFGVLWRRENSDESH